MNEYGEERRSRHHHSMGGWQETAIANLGKYLRLGTYDPEHEVKLLVRDHVLADRKVAVQPTQFAPLTREDRQRVVKCSVFITFPCPDGDDMAFGINISYTQATRFDESQSRAIHQGGHQIHRSRN